MFHSGKHPTQHAHTHTYTHTLVCVHTWAIPKSKQPLIAPPKHMAQVLKHQGLSHHTWANKNFTLPSERLGCVLSLPICLPLWGKHCQGFQARDWVSQKQPHRQRHLCLPETFIKCMEYYRQREGVRSPHLIILYNFKSSRFPHVSFPLMGN